MVVLSRLISAENACLTGTLNHGLEAGDLQQNHLSTYLKRVFAIL